MNDRALLEEYLRTGSPAAFRALVDAHLALVHSAACRRVGDAHLAEDVSQQVFLLLVRKARGLSSRVVLAGWLYRAACHLASQMRRTESRRQHREQLAAQIMNLTEAEETWRRLEPLLDDAMGVLGEQDRDAVVLRYFENRSLREVGDALGISEDAAQKRLARAVEKLRAFIGKRGTAVASGALTTAIASGAVQAVPAGLGASVSAVALSGATLVTPGVIHFMSTTLLKPVVATVVVLGAATSLVVQTVRLAELRRLNGDLQTRVTAAELAVQAARDDARRGAVRVGEQDARTAEIARLRGELVRVRQSEAALRAQVAKNSGSRRTPDETERRQESDDLTQETMKTIGIAKMNYTKQWGMAFWLYANDHGGQMPGSFEQASPYLAKAASSAGAEQGADDPQPSVIDPRTMSMVVASPGAMGSNLSVLDPNQFEIMFRGKLDEVGNPAQAIVLREMEAIESPNKRGWIRTYLFADGHSEIHFAADGDFSAWENDRMPIAQASWGPSQVSPR